MVKDGEDTLTRSINDTLEKCRLDFPKCANCDVAPLTQSGKSK